MIGRNQHFEAILLNLTTAPPRLTSGIIHIDSEGNVTVIQMPSIGFTHPGVLDELQVRLEAAVKEFGEFNFKAGHSKGAYFDINTVHFPAFCNEMPHGVAKAYESISMYSCCYYNSLPLIGIGTSPCCACSLPLPIHGNQNQHLLNEYIHEVDPFNWTSKTPKAVWRGEGNGHLASNCTIHF